MSRRTIVQYAVLAVVGLLATLYSYQYMATQRQAHASAAADLADCQRMATRLKTAEAKPAPESTVGADLDTQIVSRIEAAAKSAKIPNAGLRMINPAPKVRIGDTPYMAKPTLVMLDNVTRRQFVTLVHSLVAGQTGLHAKSIRLAAPRNDDTGDRWTAEVTLNQTIYDPPQAATKAGR